jgi:hypothetical protein
MRPGEQRVSNHVIRRDEFIAEIVGGERSRLAGDQESPEVVPHIQSRVLGNAVDIEGSIGDETDLKTRRAE